MKNILLSKTGYWRKREFRVRTDIVEEKGSVSVVKTAMGLQSKEILSRIKMTYTQLKTKMPSNIRPVKPLLVREDSVVFEYCPGKSLQALIEQCLIDKDFDKAKEYFATGLQIIRSLPARRVEMQKIGEDAETTLLFPPNPPVATIELLIIPLSEVTADHILADRAGYALIDYEVFEPSQYIPKQLVLFRYIFHLLNTLQQVITSVSSEHLPIVGFLSNLYIPETWLDEIGLSYAERLYYLEMEEMYYQVVNIDKPDFSHFKKRVDPKRYTHRIRARITMETAGMPSSAVTVSVLKQKEELIDNMGREIDYYKEMLEKITSAKFYKVWQSYCGVRDTLLGKRTK